LAGSWEAAYIDINPFIPSAGQSKNSRKIPNFIFPNPPKEIEPLKSAVKENSFVNGHTIGFHPDSKLRSTLHVSMIDLGSERVKDVYYYCNI